MTMQWLRPRPWQQYINHRALHWHTKWEAHQENSVAI